MTAGATLAPSAPHRPAPSGSGRRIESSLDRGLHGFKRGELVGRQEAGDRRTECDGRRFRAREPVDLVWFETGDPVQETRQRLGRIERSLAGRSRDDALIGPRDGATTTARAPSAGLADRCPDAPLVVVPRAQLWIAQPVMGDIDPLRALETGRPGDVRVMLAQERAPGDLDDLRARIDGDLEAAVQVVGGERRARWHS